MIFVCKINKFHIKFHNYKIIIKEINYKYNNYNKN